MKTLPWPEQFDRWPNNNSWTMNSTLIKYSRKPVQCNIFCLGAGTCSRSWDARWLIALSGIVFPNLGCLWKFEPWSCITQLLQYILQLTNQTSKSLCDQSNQQRSFQHPANSARFVTTFSVDFLGCWTLSIIVMKYFCFCLGCGICDIDDLP